MSQATTTVPHAELRERLLRRLDEVKDPCSVTAGNPMGLAEMGLVRSVDISDAGRVTVVLRLTSPFCEMIGFFTSQVTEKTADLDGVRTVTVQTDSGFDWSPDDMAPHLQRQREQRLLAIRADVAAHRRLPLTIQRRETP